MRNPPANIFTDAEPETVADYLDSSVLMAPAGASLRFGELYRERGIEACRRVEMKLKVVEGKYTKLRQTLYSRLVLIKEEVELLALNDGKKKQFHLFGLKFEIDDQ